MKVHANEEEFQREVLKEFRALGWYAVHLSPPTVPGWQDVLALKSPYGLVLELKVFTDDDLEKPVKNLFTKAQAPRYIEQIRGGVGEVNFAFYDKESESGEFRYIFQHIGLVEQVPEVMGMDLHLFLWNGIPFRTCEGMVKFITQTTEGICPF